MHYYVYQFFGEPKQEGDWAPEWLFTEHPTFFPIANTIAPADKRSEVIQQFGRWMDENRLGTLSQDSFILTPDARANYFKGRFDVFQKAAAALQSVSETQFASDHCVVEDLLSKLYNSFSSVLGDYVLLGNDSDPISMDQFIRTATPGQPYYFGAVLDYK